MTAETGIVLAGVLLILLPLLLACFFAFDRVVRLEYASYRSAWEPDGRPRGFFWRPSESTLFGSYFARQRFSLTWLFSTPTWAQHDQSASRLLKRLRRLVLAWNLAIIVAAVIVWRWGVQAGRAA